MTVRPRSLLNPCHVGDKAGRPLGAPCLKLYVPYYLPPSPQAGDKAGTPLDALAKQLSNKAVELGSTDDVTVMLIKLGPQ